MKQLGLIIAFQCYVVGSFGQTPEGDIRDIKDLESLPIFWWWYALLVILLLLIVGCWYYWKKKKGKKQETMVDVIVLPPHEIALASFSELRSSNYLDHGKIKLFHFLLSEILRKYIEGRFLVPATDRTTDELASLLSNNSFLSESRVSLLKILRKTDLVKFTDFIMSREESLELLDLAESFVQNTKPGDVVK